MDAFDADVLIYAAGHIAPHGPVVRDHLFASAASREDGIAGVGSVLLLPELLSKPIRERWTDEVEGLGELLAWLDLRPVDETTARTAAWLGAAYGLKAVDATHLATAVGAGADRFITNNRRDFGPDIAEIDIVYPEDLADVG